MTKQDIFSDDKTWRIVHELLKHLDYLKPLMIMPLSILENDAPHILKLTPPQPTLEFWSVKKELVGKIIPFYQSFMLPIVDLLSFPRDDGTQLISILDFLTVMCLFMCGDWKRKAKLLFSWYNLNGQGLLEEEEHFLMIRRIGHCFRQLKLIRLLELRDDEAKYLALTARVRYNPKGEGTFIPGLYFEDFLEWTLTNEECQLVFFFSKVLNRLCDILRTLGDRSERLTEIINDMYENKEYSVPAPLPGTKLFFSPNVFLVQKTSKTISVAIDIRKLSSAHLLPTNPNFYLTISNLVPVLPLNPHYEINHNIIDRQHPLHEKTLRDGLQCCQKVYRKIHTRLINPFQNKFEESKTKSLFRFEVDELDANQDFEFEISHQFLQFSTFRCTTLPEYKKDMIIESKRKVIITPAGLSFDKFVKLFPQMMNQDHSIIFSGFFNDFSQVSSLHFSFSYSIKAFSISLA